MIDDKEGHIPLPLIMFSCTALRHALQEWQKNKSVHPKASKSKLKANRPDRSNYLNYKNDAGKDTSCCAAMGRKLLTSPGVSDTYTFLINTWNTLPESYQQRVNNNTLATVKRQIQQTENPMPTVVISVEAGCVDNAIVVDYLTSTVALEEPEIRSTDPNIPIENNCTYDNVHTGMPGGCGNFQNVGNKIDVRNAIPIASQRRRPATELERFSLGNCDVDGYVGEDGDDTDADKVEDESQANDGSTQNVED